MLAAAAKRWFRIHVAVSSLVPSDQQSLTPIAALMAWAEDLACLSMGDYASSHFLAYLEEIGS